MAEVEQLINKLVEELKSLGLLHEPEIEAAFRSVPRHLFTPDLPLQDVYLNRSIPTKYLDGRLVSSSSQPSIMAIMLEQLDLHPGLNILEIGAGTGYNAALLAQITGEGGQVTTIDIDVDIVANARQHLADAGFDRVQVVCADGGFGYPAQAPYDRILLTASAPDILPAWREQLKDGGRLVLPLAIGISQVSVAFQKIGERLESSSVIGCGFMPLRGAFTTGLVQWTPIGTDSGLRLGTVHQPSASPAEVSAWLQYGPTSTQGTEVQITSREALADLQTWLMIQTDDWCLLTTTGEKVNQGLLPAVAGFGGSFPWAFTCGLISDNDMAVFAPPPDRPVKLEDPNQEMDANPFDLHICMYGKGDSFAQRLAELVHAWEKAGRPAAESLQLRSYPIHYSPVTTDGEYLLRGPYSTLVLRYSSC